MHQKVNYVFWRWSVMQCLKRYMTDRPWDKYSLQHSLSLQCLDVCRLMYPHWLYQCSDASRHCNERNCCEPYLSNGQSVIKHCITLHLQNTRFTLWRKGKVIKPGLKKTVFIIGFFCFWKNRGFLGVFQILQKTADKNCEIWKKNENDGVGMAQDY